MAYKEDKDTKRILSESFKKQLLKRPFEKITIKMITDDAGVIRPTFYNYYKDKYEVFEYILDEELINITYALVDNGMEREAIKMIFTYFDKNRDFYHEAFKVEGQNSFEEILLNKIALLFERIIGRHQIRVEDGSKMLSEKNIAKYYSVGMVYIIKEWMLEDRYKEVEPDEMFDAYLFIITHSAVGII